MAMDPRVVALCHVRSSLAFVLYLVVACCRCPAAAGTQAACYDSPNWANSFDCASEGAVEAQGCIPEGWTCAAYETKGWCSVGKPVAGQEKWIGQLSNYPETNCCICGGRWAPTVQDAMKALQETQQSMTNIENAVGGLHKELSKAEYSLVAAAEKAGQARRGLRALRNKTLTNQHELRNFSRTMARWKANVTQQTIESNSLIGRAEDLMNSTAQVAADTAKIATPAVLNNLEEINQRIFKATEPQGDQSISAFEKKLRELTPRTTDFQKEIEERVHSLLVKRFRRGADGIRKAVRELGVAATSGG